MKKLLFGFIFLFWLYLNLPPKSMNQYLRNQFLTEIKRIDQVCSSNTAKTNLSFDLDSFSFGDVFSVIYQTLSYKPIQSRDTSFCCVEPPNMRVRLWPTSSSISTGGMSGTRNKQSAPRECSGNTTTEVWLSRRGWRSLSPIAEVTLPSSSAEIRWRRLFRCTTTW